MKYQYFSLGLELLLPERQNRVGISSFFAIGLCESTGRIANMLGIVMGFGYYTHILKTLFK
jgi:hypothetical protein